MLQKTTPLKTPNPALKATDLIQKLLHQRDLKQAQELSRFFKTGPGQYGHGDRFLGIKVPVLRNLARSFRALPLSEIKKLFKNPWHEVRFSALILLVKQYERADTQESRRQLFEFYLQHTQYINNWDLVDISAPRIPGPYLLSLSKKDSDAHLNQWINSNNLWQRRIAVLSMAAWIRDDRLKEALRWLKLSLPDSEDLMHKANGWMLREVGKKDPELLRNFLRSYYSQVPRTTLRYAIERWSPSERKRWLRSPN